MRVNVVAIGNSKGIRIPKVILQQCHIKEYVNLKVENEYIVIKPYHKKPRRNWEKVFEKMHKNKDDKLLINDSLDMEIKDWIW